MKVRIEGPGVVVPSDVAAPSAANANNRQVIREMWPRDKIRAFDAMAPANISLVATDGPLSLTTWTTGGDVKERIGHNRGVWPVKCATSSSRKDTATATYNKASTYFQGTQFRVWAPTPAERDQVLNRTSDLIAARSEQDGCGRQLENGFRDLGADLNLDFFELEIHALARAMGIPVWDDTALSNFLDHVLERERQIVASSRVGRFSPLEVAVAAALADIRDGLRS